MSAFFVCWAGLITFVKPNRIYKVILGDDVSISCGQAGLVPGIITSQEENNFAESACWTYSNNYCSTGMIIQDNQLKSIEYTDSNDNIVGSKIINSEYRNWKTGYEDTPPNCNGICNVVIDYMGYWEILLNDELNDDRLLCHEDILLECPSIDNTPLLSPIHSLYNNIDGCGLNCYSQLDTKNIYQCSQKCALNHLCKGYTFAAKGDDIEYPNDPVCTLYDKDTPTSEYVIGNKRSKQIFCALNRYMNKHQYVTIPITETCTSNGYKNIVIENDAKNNIMKGICEGVNINSECYLTGMKYYAGNDHSLEDEEFNPITYDNFDTDTIDAIPDSLDPFVPFIKANGKWGLQNIQDIQSNDERNIICEKDITRMPSQTPTKAPIQNPSKHPTNFPTNSPTSTPTVSPTISPTIPIPNANAGNTNIEDPRSANSNDDIDDLTFNWTQPNRNKNTDNNLNWNTIFLVGICSSFLILGFILCINYGRRNVDITLKQDIKGEYKVVKRYDSESTDNEI